MCSSRIAGGLRVPLCPFKREVEPQRYSLQFSSDHQCREIESDGPDAVPPGLERELDGWLDRTGDAFGTTDDYMRLIDLTTGLVHDRAALKRP